MTMLYALIAMFALIVAVLMLRLRIRGFIDSNNRLLFVGLGQTGPEFDFVAGQGVVRLFGVRIKTFPLEKEKKEDLEPAAPEPEEPEEVEKPEVKKPGKVRPRQQIWEVRRAGVGFPQPVELRPGISRWWEDEVDAWLESRRVTSARAPKVA